MTITKQNKMFNNKMISQKLEALQKQISITKNLINGQEANHFEICNVYAYHLSLKTWHLGGHQWRHFSV